MEHTGSIAGTGSGRRLNRLILAVAMAAAVVIPTGLALGASASSASTSPSPGTITTVAGNGTDGSSGNGGPATSATFSSPSQAVEGPDGYLYISDAYSDTVRKVSPSGVITAAAGTGNPGLTGNGGPAVDAEIADPTYIAFDASGNLYIADDVHDVIRKVNTAGIISTVVGTGVSGDTGDGGPATAAEIEDPQAIAFDRSGNLYIADGDSYVVRKVSPSGIISTFAGTGVDSSTGNGGPATAATFEYPSAVAADAAGNVYIGDSEAHDVRVVDSSGVIHAFAGNGSATPAGGPGPATSVAVDGAFGIAASPDGTVFIGDYGQNRVYAVSPSGNLTTIAGTGAEEESGDNGPATAAALNGPNGISLDASGNLYTADWRGHTVRKIWGAAPTGLGYNLVASDGGIFSYGDAGFFGSAGSLTLNKPIVGSAATPTHHGYWLVASDGGVFSYGDAVFYGSTGSLTLNKPIVGIAATPDGKGYWLVASDGGVFAYGDAVFYGSTGSLTLNKPIVGIAATPDGKGYWLVASDGGIFAYGDAVFYGSAGSLTLNKPIVGVATTPNGQGYWLVASDGGIFAYGNAVFYGSTGSLTLNKPIVGVASTPDGLGYWLVASDGGIFAYGDAGFFGSAGSLTLNKPVVGIIPGA